MCRFSTDSGYSWLEVDPDGFGKLSMSPAVLTYNYSLQHWYIQYMHCCIQYLSLTTFKILQNNM